MMARLSRTIRPLWQCAGMLRMFVVDATHFFLLCLRPRAALAAENLFLRKQLALYQEGHVTPQRASNATRCTLVWLSQWFDWQPALTVVQPETFKRWRRQQFRLFWRGTSCPGRPPIPVELQGLIRQMARDNLTWGQRRITNELLLKLGLRVSPRTVRKHMPTRLDRAPGCRVPSQRWRTFLRNHARNLIIRGGAVDLTQSVQAVSARLIRILQSWRGRAVASELQEPPQSDSISLSLLRDTVSVPAAWFPDPGDVISVAERSPPAIGLPCNHVPFTADRTTQVDTCALHARAGGPVREGQPCSTRTGQHQQHSASIRTMQVQRAA